MIGSAAPTRETLVHRLYEAAELEHNLMCTYLYSAFSLRDADSEGLSADESVAVARWRAAILAVAVEEMGHLTAVWNITAALGAAPRFGRTNFPLEAGILPADVVVKLAPFSAASLQHFIHLERPHASLEPEGEGFKAELDFKRGTEAARLTPMALDYEAVGDFYKALGEQIHAFVGHVGEKAAFCGDPALQLGPDEVALLGARPVVCLKTALAAFTAIVEQGEGAPEHSVGSHFQKFAAIRDELNALLAVNPTFEPALPAATNPVLRRPPRPEGRVWIQDERAAATVDLANTGYALMLRLLAYSYVVPRPRPEKALSISLALGLMRAVTHLAERAARLPAGPSNPRCNAGMSFTALRDSAPLLTGPSAGRFIVERFEQIVEAAALLDQDGDARTSSASRILIDLAKRAARGFQSSTVETAPVAAAPVATAPVATAPLATAPTAAAAATTPPVPTVIDGVEHIAGKKLTLLFEARKCIHSRFCVTGAPTVFIANIKGPWINPDAVPVESLVEIAHVCPSGAIRYERRGGVANESAPPVNLIGTREAGPYAVRGDIRLDGESVHYRATLCRCGASKNKPYCDGSHHEVGFSATGEPPTGAADMLPTRDGPLEIDPEIDGPLHVRGNLEIISGTGRVVSRVTTARLCRCGGSNTKPFCDGTHARIGFKST
jgi:CDGSH-type Zn-finger protein/uncharacterized Fe-S cluster protein YjdI